MGWIGELSWISYDEYKMNVFGGKIIVMQFTILHNSVKTLPSGVQ